MPLIPTSYCFMLLGVSEIGLALFKRAGRSAESKDRGSFLALWGVIGLSIFCAISVTHALPEYGVAYSDALYWTGLLLFVLGTALRWWSIIHLGKFFTVNVAIAADHRVVDNGPYRYVRHPSYSGVFVAFIGLGLLLFNWLSLLVLVLPVVGMFMWRISVEERALRNALGQPYEAYMQRTKRLVPWVL
ncbi:MAG: isoprenylcysteine carboxylmethyltransferase family protein [Flavobacteriales bacterium]